MAHDEKSRLGRGLAALIGDVGDEAAVLERTRSQRRVPIEFLKPNPRNPRRNFADAELDELAASIRERGIIQPILVRTVRGAMDQYEIVAGERRWRAAQRAGLHDVPVLLLEVNDREALELAIIENVQRTDLNALEEAGGYQALMNEFDYSQDDVAKIVGKSRPHVANTLRLLKLSEPVKAYITLRPAQRRTRAPAGRPAERRGVCRADRRARAERAPGRADGAARRQEAGARAAPHRPHRPRSGRGRAGEAPERRARPDACASCIASTARACSRSATARSNSSTTSRDGSRPGRSSGGDAECGSDR